jgi:hypothetical protein
LEGPLGRWSQPEVELLAAGFGVRHTRPAYHVRQTMSGRGFVRQLPLKLRSRRRLPACHPL